MTVRQLSTCLWFDDDLEEALELYERVLGDLHRRAPDQLDPSTGGLLAVRFELAGQPMVAIQGGPGPKHTEAMSLYLLVEGGQAEVDRIWGGLLEGGGTPSQCGWLADRFGISWQVVPVELEDAMTGTDPERAASAFRSMLTMQKIVIADL